MSQKKISAKSAAFLSLIKRSLKGEHNDFTVGSIRVSVVLLAVPMMLEMAMESIFALVDLYFVGHLKHSSFAIQAVGLTESVLTILYSIAIGISMAATAVVARRIGEKNPEAAAKAGIQAVIIAVAVTILISVFGFIFATDILRLMGASPEAALYGTDFVRIMMASSVVIVCLFLFNGIFRGAGNASIAMKSLFVANLANIVLCPLLVGFKGFDSLGLTGAAIATTIGRSLGVLYQLYHLFNGRNVIVAHISYFKPQIEQIKHLVKISAPAVGQFVIASCSWIFLANLVATTGGDVGSAGYQTSLRLMMFFMLPAWGLSGAAATLVGQNLGAKRVERAERSVLVTAKCNAIYMGSVMVISLLGAHWLAGIFSNDAAVREIGTRAVRIMACGYVFYGIGMVMINAFNGSGDTKTPTWINFFGFWLFQIPLAYLLSKVLDFGPTGVFIAIPVAETCIAIAGFILFKRGRWKTIEV
jgi:putative MATE family efflux protein